MSRHGGHGGHGGGGFHGGFRGGHGGFRGGYPGGWGWGYGTALGLGLTVPLLAGAALASQPSTVIYANAPPPQPIAYIPTNDPLAVAQSYPGYQVYYVPRV